MKDLSFADELDAVKSRRRWYQLTAQRSFGIIFGVGCVLGLVALLAVAVEAAREAARRSQCVCNFCQITLALHNYHSTFGAFPPAHLDDAHGKPMHSWRVLLLPFMEQHTLYNMYNFSEPWDGPGNRKLIGMMPTGLACPSRVARRGNNGCTSYVAVTGPGTVFPGDGTVRTLADVKDGTSSTIFAAEVDNIDIPWTEPRDLDVRTMSFRVNDPKRAGISSRHPGGANVSFVDGGKRFLPERVTPEELKALFTIDGGEAINVEAILSTGSRGR